MLITINDLLGNSPIEMIGSIISAVATLIFIVSAIVKKKKLLLIIQSIAHTILIISELIVNAWASIIQEIIGILRNIATIFEKNTKQLNIILIISGVIVGLLANFLAKTDTDPFFGSWVGLLPIIANTEYSIVVLHDGVKLKSIKLAFFFSSSLWGIHFIIINYYFAGILNFITAIISLITYFSLQKKEKRNLLEKDKS